MMLEYALDILRKEEMWSIEAGREDSSKKTDIEFIIIKNQTMSNAEAT